MFDPHLLKNKVVLITGGATGIGFEMTQKSLLFGAHTVIIASRKKERLEAVYQSLGEPKNLLYKNCDIRSEEELLSLVDFIKEKVGTLDILVNNAGGQFPSAVENLSIKGWNAVINNNLNGTFMCTQVMAQHFFIPAQKGNIINIIANVFRGFPGMAHTGAARAGVENLSKSLAVEWAPYQIRINNIAPGIIASSGLDQYPDELKQGLSETIPMKRLGTPEEVAYLFLFLASEMSRYMTGETIYLDGGQRLWGDVYKI